VKYVFMLMKQTILEEISQTEKTLEIRKPHTVFYECFYTPQIRFVIYVYVDNPVRPGICS